MGYVYICVYIYYSLLTVNLTKKYMIFNVDCFRYINCICILVLTTLKKAK